MLAESDGGGDSVYKLGKSGVTDVAELPPPPSSDAYPANPDAIAVGPQGALAILRTPSGAEPPSDTQSCDDHPARRATDCARELVDAHERQERFRVSRRRERLPRDDPGIVRAVGTDPRRRERRVRADVDARTRALEPDARVSRGARDARVGDRAEQNGDVVETSIIAQFAGPAPTAGRLAIARGSERHRAMSCAIGVKPRLDSPVRKP